MRRDKYKLDDDAHLSQLLYGETAAVLEAKGDWVRVRAEEQDSFLPASAWGRQATGWMRADALVSAEPYAANTVVRVRQALVHRGEEILTMSVGTRLLRVSESSPTASVRLLDGSLGEIHADEFYVPPALPTARVAGGDHPHRGAVPGHQLLLGRPRWRPTRPQVRRGLLGARQPRLPAPRPRTSLANTHEQKLKARPIRSAEPQRRPGLPDRRRNLRPRHARDDLHRRRRSHREPQVLGTVLRTTFLERFGRAAANIESGDVVNDLSFPRPRRRRIFFGSYF